MTIGSKWKQRIRDTEANAQARENAAATESDILAREARSEEELGKFDAAFIEGGIDNALQRGEHTMVMAVPTDVLDTRAWRRYVSWLHEQGLDADTFIPAWKDEDAEALLALVRLRPAC